MGATEGSGAREGVIRQRLHDVPPCCWAEDGGWRPDDVGASGASKQEPKARSATLGQNLDFSQEGRRQELAEAKDREGGRE